MKLLFRPEAVEELAEIRAWYESQGRGLGNDFMRSIEVALAQIARFPSAASGVQGDVRRTLVRKFPYSLFHAVEGDFVVILGCIHQHRAPIHWPQLDH
ncbi:MAG: type II toxin-antitoxin system RelE/ParE family toxin [Thiobacillus sp.]|nr:type II toxin-antitoxin system RelE/ParE family toxin [Thiobacillus sp.]